jgi:hypothetical protein
VESFGNWAVGTFFVFVVALVFFSFLTAVICLIVSVELAVVMWSPLRGWLGIPEPAPPGAGSRREGELIEPGLDIQA